METGPIKSRLAAWSASLWVRIGLGVVISALALYLALRDVSTTAIGATLATADAGYVALALLTVAVNTWAKTVRWKVLLGPAGRAISLWHLLVSLLVGQMLNTIIPARAGDLSRAVVIGGMGPGRVFVLGTVVIEKVLDLICYALLFVCLLALIPLPGWLGESSYVLVGVACLAALSLIVAVNRLDWISHQLERAGERLPGLVKVQLIQRLQAGLASLSVLHGGREQFQLAAWSLVVWITAVLTNQLTLLALHIPAPLTASLLLLAVLQAGVTIPSVPGRIGVFEYLCVLTLAIFGQGQAIAFAYGVLLHAIVLLPATVAGLLFWIADASGRQRKPAPVP